MKLLTGVKLDDIVNQNCTDYFEIKRKLFPHKYRKSLISFNQISFNHWFY